VFIDISFINIEDFSSQIRFMIILVDNNKANLIYWSSIKYKQITRSVLALELYMMAYGFNIRTLIQAILEKILR
jgi:uncharacterized membrane protein